MPLRFTQSAPLNKLFSSSSSYLKLPSPCKSSLAPVAFLCHSLIHHCYFRLLTMITIFHSRGDLVVPLPRIISTAWSWRWSRCWASNGSGGSLGTLSSLRLSHCDNRLLPVSYLLPSTQAVSTVILSPLFSCMSAAFTFLRL